MLLIEFVSNSKTSHVWSIFVIENLKLLPKYVKDLPFSTVGVFV